MAEIYLATAESIEGITRQVAIKRVLPSLTQHDNFIRMFVDEARLSMQLTHANIVQVFDVGRSAGSYYIVMEFVEGFDLRRIFQRACEVGVVIPLEIACFLAMEVCKGLAYAHEKRDPTGRHLRIVHRDLSPPNVLVSRAGEVKITDFGLAKAITQSDITDPGVVKGKFSYLSPEAAQGHEVDHRADIFATGICLWELISRRRLFAGKNDADTVELVKATRVPPLGKFHDSATPEFEQILGRALAADPSRRYTSAREFGEALAEYLFSRNLRVTGYDVSSFVERLFGDDPEQSVQSMEERIAGLMQEEVLNLSVLGMLGFGNLDGSKPVDVSSLSMPDDTMVALDRFWPERSAIEGRVEASGPEPREPAVGANQLLRLLEGDDAVIGDTSEVANRPWWFAPLVFAGAVGVGVAIYFLVSGT